MRIRSLMFAALSGAMLLTAAAPAFADRDDHRDGHVEHHERYAPREHRDWDRGYYAPPVVVSPPAYGYYNPPPVAYGPAPSITFGITIP